MKIQLEIKDTSNKTKVTIAERQAGQTPVKHTVSLGEKITVIIDGITLTGSQTVANQKIKLIKRDRDLIIKSEDDAQEYVELKNFYTEPDAILMGDQWVIADASQLRQLSEGVIYAENSGAAIAQVAASSLFTTTAVAVPTAIAVASQAAKNEASATANAPTVAIPEANNGVNAAEAADGLSVVVTLPQGAAVGDVITVSIDGSTPVSYTVTASDVSASLNPSGTVSVLLPAADVSAAGQGAATVTTTYTDAAGNPATGGAVQTDVFLGNSPAAPTVDIQITNNLTPIITGTATLQAEDHLKVVINGAVYNDVFVSNTGHWSIDTATAVVSSGQLLTFTDGHSYSVDATVINVLGSSSDLRAEELTIDTSVSAPVLALHQDMGLSGSDLLTANGTIDVSGLEIGATWEYSLDGGNSWNPGNGGTAVTTTTDRFVATQGAYVQGSVLVRQTDAANNTSDHVALNSTSTRVQPVLYNLSDGANVWPKVVALSDGGYVVAWQSELFSQQGLVWGGFAQRYDSSNRAIGNPVELPNDGLLQNMNLDIAATVDAGYLVVWNRESSTGTDLYVQRYDADNLAVASLLSFSASSNPLQGQIKSPRIVALENGGAYSGCAVVWSDESSDYYVQGIDSHHQLMGSSQALGVLGNASKLDVVALHHGGYVVSGSYSNPPNVSSMARVFDNDHNLVGQINLTESIGQWTAVQALSDGGFLMAYVAGNNEDIYLLRSDATGNLLQPPVSLNRLSTTSPKIAVLNNGDYVVTWSEGTLDNQISDVFVQHFDGSTNAADMPVARLQCGDGLEDSYPQIVSLTGGDYLVSWGGGGSSHIFTQRFDIDGNLKGSVKDITPNFDNMSTVSLTALNDGGYVATVHQALPEVGDHVVHTLRFDATDQLMDESLALTVDTTAPVLDTSAPLDNQQDYVSDGNFTFVFNETVVLGDNGHIVFKDLTDGTSFDIDLANPAGQLHVLDRRLIIDPANDLTPGHHYAIHADAGVITDLAGNSSAGITDDTSFNFTVALPSTLDFGNNNDINLHLIGGTKLDNGKWYYYLDLTGNGDANDNLDDQITHDQLDNLFNAGADTFDTQINGAALGIDDERSVIINGFTLVLPTETELHDLLAALNPTDDIWSHVDPYWSATNTQAEWHSVIYANDPLLQPSSASDTWLNSVAIQVII